MAAIQAVKGFKDILPEEAGKWQYVEARAREVFSAFGLQEIRTPILEKTELFQRGIGATTDIVEKEMYSFTDRGDEHLTLRPEATASVIRAYVEHKLYNANPVAKLFTIGPMFRRERPQKGRFRQFHQINVEFLGIDAPSADGEIILLLSHYLQSLGLNNLRLEINSLGCSKCRLPFRQSMLDFLAGKEAGLCEDCRRRLNTNPMRILDCKNEDCRKIMADAPGLSAHLCPECRDHFASVQGILNNFNLSFNINPHMVRGLDYYKRTAFEVTMASAGAQNAVAGGGRYDGLVSELGGPDTAGIGFAIGMERLLSLLPQKSSRFTSVPRLFIAALGGEAVEKSFMLCNSLRLKGIGAEMDYGAKSLKSQMKRADRLGSRYVLIVGENELRENLAELRDMETGAQEKISIAGWEDALANKLKTR